MILNIFSCTYFHLYIFFSEMYVDLFYSFSDELFSYLLNSKDFE